MMDNLQIEQYEYARKRIRQKKNVFFHFILFFVGSIFLYIINKVVEINDMTNWYLWAITVWGFVFILHVIKVFITDSFMNKNWESHQIDRLVSMQQKKIQKLQDALDAKHQNTQ